MPDPSVIHCYNGCSRQKHVTRFRSSLADQAIVTKGGSKYSLFENISLHNFHRFICKLLLENSYSVGELFSHLAKLLFLLVLVMFQMAEIGSFEILFTFHFLWNSVWYFNTVYGL